MKSKYDVIKKIKTTEKTSVLAKDGFFVFSVAKDANKKTIKKAVKEIFSVKVLAVNVLNVKSCSKRFKGKEGIVSGFKKAIVKIDGADNIDLSKIN